MTSALNCVFWGFVLQGGGILETAALIAEGEGAIVCGGRAWDQRSPGVFRALIAHGEESWRPARRVTTVLPVPSLTTRTCACGEPIHPCPYGPVLVDGRQLWIMWCEGWLHATGSHRCHWPGGVYGPEGAARPREETA